MWEYLLLLCKNTVRVIGYQAQMVQGVQMALQHQEGPGYHCILKAQEAPEDLVESYLRSSPKHEIFYMLVILDTM